MITRCARIVFGAHGQLAVGILAFAVSCAAWVYGSSLRGEALVRFIFHASMFALVIASYAIIATALGYRATERVEAQVVNNIEHADEVEIEQAADGPSTRTPSSGSSPQANRQ